MLGKELPSWKQLFRLRETKKSELLSDDEKWYFLAESCMSIKLIIYAIRKKRDDNTVSVLLPAYFCSQTYYSFKEEWIVSEFYPIKDNLEPDWEYIKELSKAHSFDCMLFVHYFGGYRDISRAREFCNLNNIILIEDCAHITFKYDKYGKIGDFAIFSPHKTLPIPDGAIMYANSAAGKNSIDELIEKVDEIYNQLGEVKNNCKWYIKKYIQKITGYHRESTYSFGVHYGEKMVSHSIYKGSKKSFSVVSEITEENFKRIAYIRRDNLTIMNYLIKKENPDIICLNNIDSFFPYFAAYSMKNVKNKEAFVETLIEKGFLLLYWPDLPLEVHKLEFKTEIENMSEDVFVIPIHQDLSPCKLLEKYGNRTVSMDSDVTSISFDNVTKERWVGLLKQTGETNIPQDWEYGFAKKDVEGWRVTNGIVLDKSENGIGVVQILEKTIFGKPIVRRINRGPVFISDYNKPNNHIVALSIIKSRLKHIPLLAAPFTYFDVESLEKMVSLNWKCRDMFGFSSATIDLRIEEGQLYKNLKPFWKKNLRKAENELIIQEDTNDWQLVIKLYEEFLNYKNIPGIPINILKYMFKKYPDKFKIFTAHNRTGEMIAYKVLYLHVNTATSFIAWNTEEGRLKNARTLLIYNSILWLKRNGYSKFDLGGVDDIMTAAVAKYKRGAGGTDYRLIGEYWVR